MENQNDYPKGPLVPRLEMLLMSLDTISQGNHNANSNSSSSSSSNSGDIKSLFRIYISDGTVVCEAYNPVKLDLSYIDLSKPQDDSDVSETGLIKQRDVDDGHFTGLRFQPHKDDGDIQLSHSSSSSRGFKRFWRNSTFKHFYLQLTGPNGEIMPYDYFSVIVHPCSGNPVVDDLHLKIATPKYVQRRCLTPSDEIYNWYVHDSLSFDRIQHLEVHCAFGSLKLCFLVFNDSKLVTLDVKWFGTAGDGGINNAPTSETYICGRLSVCSNKHNIGSLLLKTPKGKAIRVQDDNSIPMLRYIVALPYFSDIIVKASLHDPFNNSVVKGIAKFDFNDFYGGDVRKSYTEKKSVHGIGAMIIVEVKVTL